MIHPAMACNPCKHGICEYEGECETCIAQDRVRELEAALRVAEDNEEERAGQVVELDERVRELEAVTSDSVLSLQRDYKAMKARAEKAEARVAELEARIHRHTFPDEAREREAE